MKKIKDPNFGTPKLAEMLTNAVAYITKMFESGLENQANIQATLSMVSETKKKHKENNVVEFTHHNAEYMALEALEQDSDEEGTPPTVQWEKPPSFEDLVTRFRMDVEKELLSYIRMCNETTTQQLLDMFPTERYLKLEHANKLNSVLMKYKVPVYLKDFVDVLAFWRINKD